MTTGWQFTSQSILEHRLRRLGAEVIPTAAPIDVACWAHPVEVTSPRVVGLGSSHARTGGAWRTALADGARQLLADAGDLTMMVDIAPDPARPNEIVITGQLVGNRSVASVQATRSGVEVSLTVVDQFGQFELRGLETGLIELIVCDDSRELVVPVEL